MKALRRLWLLLVLAEALPTAIGAADFTIPPTPVHRVTDNAGALSDSARTKVENELRAYESATGHQIIVWIGQTTGDVALETWTVDAAHKWGIGRHGHDDGAVLFLFMQDHKIRIEVGYGLEGALTDADASRIIADQIRPRMRAGDVDGAVESGVAAMLTTITPNFAGATPPPEPAEQPAGPGTIAVVIIMVIVVVGSFGFMIFIVIMRLIGSARYGYLVLREGSKSAKSDMKSFPFWSSGGGGGGSFSSGGDDDSGSDFSSGGGDFGGGGASGSW